MARSVEVRGRIDDFGKLFITNMQHIGKWIRAHKEKEVRLTLEEFGKARSNPQNRYYRGLVVPMVMKAMNEFGNEMDHEETHEFLKSKFNYREVLLKDGLMDKVPTSTAKLDTIAFMDYILKIQKFGSEDLGIFIPDPDLNYQTEFFNTSI